MTDLNHVQTPLKRKLKIRFGVGTPHAEELESAKRPKSVLQSESPVFNPEQALRHQRTEAVADYLSQGFNAEQLISVKSCEITMSRIFKAASMQLSDCLKIVTSTKGYRTAKATHGVEDGCWYYEATVRHLGESGHCRIGWATKSAHLHAPVGYDKFGYSYRDLEGTKQHQSRREEYGDSYTQGDIIGCLIYIPEQKEEENSSEKEETFSGSLVVFTKNGSFQGVAFRDITKGVYYPAVSLFTRPEQTEGASIELNFGPAFEYKYPEVPDLDVEIKGMHEIVNKIQIPLI
eukprot:g475.t1